MIGGSSPAYLLSMVISDQAFGSSLSVGPAICLRVLHAGHQD